jgi:hypothetical protein
VHWLRVDGPARITIRRGRDGTSEIVGTIGDAATP